MRIFILLFVTLMSTGCATWPKPGQGGWGENFLRHETGNESIWYTESYANLRRDLDYLRLRLDVLRARGIVDCMPAKLKLATLMASRITRQLNAKMYAQTEHDLGIFYHQVNLLQVHFEPVQEATGCGRTKVPVMISGSVKKTAESLLNSDNQFAFADDNITPKFAMRIAQAAKLLAAYQRVAILIMGHTDVIGDDGSNVELGMSRAQKVKQALIDAGLSHAHITVISKGEAEPYAEGTSLATRLSNRRVESVILELSDGQMIQHSLEHGMPLTDWTHHLGQEKE